MKPFTKQDILTHLDDIYNRNMDIYLKDGERYCDFFLDLEDTRLSICGNRIHLFANNLYWAIVFEKNGYSVSGGYPEINLEYIGNCIIYEKSGSENTNLTFRDLISPEEVDRIRTEDCFIKQDVSTVEVNGCLIPIEQNQKSYKFNGLNPYYIENEEFISFEDFVFFLNQNYKDIIFIDDTSILKNISEKIPKLITIEDYHFTSNYDRKVPSKQELFNLIASILVTKDTILWKPQLKPNNKPNNWDSGI